MFGSFHTATLGAIGQQSKLDTIANNISNINTNGFKTKNAVFSDLVYTNLNADKGTNTNLQAGNGIRIEQVNTDFSQSSLNETGLMNDFGIQGQGFFMLQNPATQEVTYTRDGSFSLSLRGQQFYLASSDGNLVLDKNKQPIMMSGEGKDSNGNTPNIGIFEFRQNSGLENIGNNEFRPVAKNGPALVSATAKLIQGSVEASGVDTASEMAKMIETQRAYSYALKMVQTSDEITSTVNSLR